MAKAEYAGPAWQAIRKLILARDRGVCQIKGPRCRHRATQVDHIVAVSQGGARLDPANLQAACQSCNVGKRNREVAARARGGGVSSNGDGGREPEVFDRCVYPEHRPGCGGRGYHTDIW